MYLNSAFPNVYYEKIVANFHSTRQPEYLFSLMRELNMPEFVFRSVVLHL